MGVVDFGQAKIIGQPEVTEGYFVMTIKCTCGQTTLLFGLPGVFRSCANAKCDWDFAITGCPEETPAGPAWKIGFRRRPK
jgi:hypothetical protein